MEFCWVMAERKRPHGGLRIPKEFFCLFVWCTTVEKVIIRKGLCIRATGGKKGEFDKQLKQRACLFASKRER